MCLFRILLQVVGSSGRVEWRLDVHNITGLEILGGAVKRQSRQPGEFLMDIYDTMAAVVAFANGDALGVEKDEQGMERGEAGCIGYDWAVK